MEYPRPTIEGAELLTVPEYKEKIGFGSVPNMTIYYQMKKGNIDFSKVGDTYLVVFNDKARSYQPRDYVKTAVA